MLGAAVDKFAATPSNTKTGPRECVATSSKPKIGTIKLVAIEDD